MIPTEVLVILLILAWFLIASVLPSLILLEIFHWIRNKQEVKLPILKCVVTNLLIGTIVMILWLGSNTSAEAGMVIVVLLPFVFAAFALGGIVLGLAYRYRGRPFLVRRRKACKQQMPSSPDT